MKPGTTVYPFKSKILVFALLNIWVSEFVPTATNLPFFTAKLCACGASGLTVWIFAFITIQSAVWSDIFLFNLQYGHFAIEGTESLP